MIKSIISQNFINIFNQVVFDQLNNLKNILAGGKRTLSSDKTIFLLKGLFKFFI
jgi:hypothetical protein